VITQPDVLAFLELTDDLGIVAWFAGSWAAQAHDGLARDHDDVDLFLEARHAATIAQHLTLRGFAADRIDPWHVRYSDPHGRTIDVRLFETQDDVITHGPDDRWPATILDGYGLIGERAVRVVIPRR
jgi:hypothetical protein